MSFSSFICVAMSAALLPVSVMHGQRTNRPAAPGAALPPVSAAPTLAVVNARVWTGDPRRPWADALAIDGDRIALVGTSAEVKKLAAPSTRVVDAEGMMVVPGFIDSHVHFISGGFGLSSVQLRDAKTPAEFIRRINAYALTLPAGAWITEGNWDHEQWGGELPRRDWIDSVTPNNPVWINRLDGHMGLANSAALRAAGVDASTADVAGGTIVRGADHSPTGILKDNAQSLIDRVVPDPPAEVTDRAVDAAMSYVASNGVTSVHNMGTFADLTAFDRAHKAGRMKTRIYAVVPLASWAQLRDTVKTRGRGDSWLHIGGLKGFVDGSLGSHTAAMLQPFTDAPNDTGLFVNTPEHLYEWTSGADKAGLQVIVHAIGDKAIRTQLDIYQRVEREDGPRDRRFRIEHLQHIARADIPRVAPLGVIASMQPYHAIDDGRWAEKVIGHERAKTTYAFRSLLDAKVRLAFGSDWFVAPPTPIEGIYAAVTRRTLDDKNPGGWIPDQKIQVEDALRAYTSNAAYAEFMEKEKGTLAKGMLADFVILDRDLTKVAPETIRDTKIVMTVVGGKPVYERATP
ncbi:MAG TPA: amidohydrolase [Gemmatimonadaceae bacterium]|nr:amidohydrolase [Gemmatimonadaceae bacterium]